MTKLQTASAQLQCHEFWKRRLSVWYEALQYKGGTLPSAARIQVQYSVWRDLSAGGLRSDSLSKLMSPAFCFISTRGFRLKNSRWFNKPAVPLWALLEPLLRS